MEAEVARHHRVSMQNTQVRELVVTLPRVYRGPQVVMCLFETEKDACDARSRHHEPASA